jgi:hypothetical protein
MERPDRLNFTESDDANELLASDGLALLIGMLLDQQFPMERAFFDWARTSTRSASPAGIPTS